MFSCWILCGHLTVPLHNSGVTSQNEVDLLSKMQHLNIISLLGYSINEETRFIVYELMQNGSLETQLHGKNILSVHASVFISTQVQKMVIREDKTDFHS